MIETPVYLSSVKATGLSDDEQMAIKTMIANNPTIGDVMAGTGGARKFRYAGRGKGKSGGYRIVTFYAAEDVPVFLLDVYGKDEKDNLTRMERNELAKLLSQIAGTYRASVAGKVMSLGVRKETRR